MSPFVEKSLFTAGVVIASLSRAPTMKAFTWGDASMASSMAICMSSHAVSARRSCKTSMVPVLKAFSTLCMEV